MLFNQLISRVIFVAVLGLLSMPMMVLAEGQDKIQPTNQEALEEIGRITNLPSDTLQAIRGESPQLLTNLNDTVTAIKVVDLIYQAKDTEALTEAYNWQKGKLIDKAAEKLLPSGAVAVVAAFKAYQASLEIIRDQVFIPSVENAIYERYKGARGGAFEYQYASPNEAYDQATASGKYFPAKQKMYDELVKRKGYNPELIGDKLESKLWKDIDAFWMSRLEAKYLHELTRQNKEQLIEKVLQNSKSDIDRLKKAAARLNESKAEKPAAKKDNQSKSAKREKREEKAKTPDAQQAKPVKTEESQAGGLSFSTKPKGSGATAGQKVESCKACADAGLACVCGNSSCCCSDPAGWCDPN